MAVLKDRTRLTGLLVKKAAKGQNPLRSFYQPVAPPAPVIAGSKAAQRPVPLVPSAPPVGELAPKVTERAAPRVK